MGQSNSAACRVAKNRKFLIKKIFIFSKNSIFNLKNIIFSEKRKKKKFKKKFYFYRVGGPPTQPKR
jgi:hypothetical protein